MTRIEMLYKRKLTGSPATRRSFIQRANLISRVIEERFCVEIDDWQEKHLIYFVRVCCSEYSNATRHDYRRVITKLIMFLDKPYWLPKINKIFHNLMDK